MDEGRAGGGIAPETEQASRLKDAIDHAWESLGDGGKKNPGQPAD